jgi:tRNA-splicing ligase RtcB (3'-phosphate/5'-hydroxy nucleic acid ligase)
MRPRATPGARPAASPRCRGARSDLACYTDAVIPAYVTRISDTVWEISPAYKQGMKVPARIIATEALMRTMDAGVFEQVTNVAMLPGIVSYALCMPDGHWGYGFPIGGAAAFDPDDGIISPGGIGFDINCGMRLVRTSLTWPQVRSRLHELVDLLFERIPAGVGRAGFIRPSDDEFAELVQGGARWCLRNGYAEPEDLELTEEGGCMAGADVTRCSREALARGRDQVGTLGSGNHYLEIQVARRENIFDEAAAAAMGIDLPEQVVLMLHCGSRGFGHQVATDAVRRFVGVMGPKYGIATADRDLACAPFRSPEGQDYFAAMKCAVNLAFANRQVILHRIREVFSEVFHKSPAALGLRQVYDVTHNTAKLERHLVDGRERELLVHRKGATRAFAPGMPDIPARYRDIGQPVIIGGSMETGSYLLVGAATGGSTFFTTAHGSGRTMGRRQAKKQFKGKELREKMEARGIYVRAVSDSGLAEEAGAAYKSIDEVALATEQAGLSRRVVRLVPVGNIKG